MLFLTKIIQVLGSNDRLLINYSLSIMHSDQMDLLAYTTVRMNQLTTCNAVPTKEYYE